jgi:Na+/H+ antiporter NhaA
VGLEFKREMVHGELRNLRKALLAVFAALGGVSAIVGGGGVISLAAMTE